jgi:hypothetical protein
MRSRELGSATARALATVLLLAAGAAYTRLPFSADHGLYSYGAWRMAAGQLPYRDVGCYDAPGIYMVHGVAHALFGWDEAAVRELDLLWMGGALLLLHAIARRFAGSLGGWLAVALAAGVYLGLGYRETAQRDSFTVPFLLGALLIGLRPPSLRSSVAIGALVAAVFWLKPPMILIAAPVVAARAWWPGTWSRSVSHLASIAAGAAAVSAPIAAYFVISGTMDPFLECFVDYTRLYTSVRYPLVHQLAFLGESVVATPIGLAAIATFSGLVRARGLWLLGFATLGAFAAVLVQGKLLVSHMVPLWILLSLAAAIVLARGIQGEATWLPARRVVARVVASFGLVAAALQITTMHGTAGHPQLLASAWRTGSFRVEREDAKVARYLMNHTKPNDRILVWGVGSGAVYFLARRPAPTRLLQTYAFTSPFRHEPFIDRWRAEYLAALERDPPQYFVVMGNDAFPGVMNIDSEEGLREWRELRAWVDAHYVVETQL